ncbi:MAG: DUF945 domain-containing protein [Candidatus Riflebacteria bacterium]|nr:DUF945 domain-containing protein [Candidatus Riflebacteria bacterium]
MPTSIQPALTKSVNGLTNPDQDVPALINMLQASEFLENSDRVVHLNQLAADTNLNIEVPDMGRFALTDWSKAQISTILGFKFDKYFENASPEDKAYELNRRFARATAEVKLRTSLIGAGENSNDGTLKGIVSPSFSAIQDSQVASLVLQGLGEVEPELRIIRADITTRSTSFVIGVGRPFVPGGQNEVGDIFGGIHIMNSGVGFSSLSMTLHLTRLVCKNGMQVPLRNAEILRRRHTSGLTIERVQEEVAGKFREIPGQLRRAGQILNDARVIPVENVEATITRLLQDSHLPRKLLQPLMQAYSREPHPSAFGVAQAMTDSQTLAELQIRPEERMLLEQAAGSYLRGTTNS